jgi:membrane protein
VDASAGVYNLDRAIRHSFGLPCQRYIEARARALAGAGAVVLVLGALALGGSVVGGHTPAVVIAVIGLPTALVALTLGIATMYRFSVGSTVRASQLLPGAACAALAVVASLAMFAAYLALSTRYAAVYGAFAGLVIGMVGIYLAVYAVLLGAVLSARLKTP